MMNPERVCAVVVTFNRKELLRGCLDSLLKQTRQPDQIVIIDNHSSDGTLDLLRAEFAQLTVIPLNENRGGAGGFASGIEWAHSRGFDWIWVMDDDIEMLPGALEMLLSYREVSDFIQCRRLTPDAELNLEMLWDISACNPSQPARKVMMDRKLPWRSVQWGNFEGPLIHRSVVDQIGLPDVRFFIGGDDSIYGLEASFYTNVIYVKDYGVQRKLSAPVRRNRLNHYLMLRNRFLVHEHLTSLGLPVNTIVFWTSQLVALAWSAKMLLRDREEKAKWQMFSAVFQGLLDGAQGRFGRPPFLKP